MILRCERPKVQWDRIRIHMAFGCRVGRAVRIGSGMELFQGRPDPRDSPPKRACHSRHDKVLISSPGSNTSLAVLPLENLSGDPNLAKKCLRPEILLGGVSGSGANRFLACF